MIVDLSSPASASVNNGISSEEFSMPYIKVDEIIRMVSKYGPGTLMAKFDVETAYHSIAVHRQVSLLNEMAWLIFCRLTLADMAVADMVE